MTDTDELVIEQDEAGRVSWRVGHAQTPKEQADAWNLAVQQARDEVHRGDVLGYDPMK